MNNKITDVRIDQYGVIPSFTCKFFSNINLIVGENGTGKTFLLKALYSATRAVEEYKRGDDIRSIGDVLSEKLRWTFQVDRLGDMVTRSSSDLLKFEMTLGTNQLGYKFSSSATRKVGTVLKPAEKREANSVFIPAKEVLSLYSVILKSREIDKSFGFDDTYYDLAKALRISPKNGKNYSAFSDYRKMLNSLIDGKVEYDETSGKWFYKNNRNQKFAIGATSEGVKKVSIMDRLLSNGYLNNQSITFIDEVESSLNPDAIFQVLSMIEKIAVDMDMQFFLSSHSYFVLKKLALIAKQNHGLVTCISLSKDKNPEIHDLSDGIPENSIIDGSIALWQ